VRIALGADAKHVRNIIQDISGSHGFADDGAAHGLRSKCSNAMTGLDSYVDPNDGKVVFPEPCHCSPEQAARCAGNLNRAKYCDAIEGHAAQVNFLQDLIDDVISGVGGTQFETACGALLKANGAPDHDASQYQTGRFRVIWLKRQAWRQESFRAPYSQLLS
jgi:hypothetical protein